MFHAIPATLLFHQLPNLKTVEDYNSLFPWNANASLPATAQITVDRQYVDG